HKNTLKEPNMAYPQRYSYADYLSWELDEMVEIIKGRLFKTTAAPNRMHQKVALQLGATLLQFLNNKPCEVYIAPFDVRLPRTSTRNEDIYTVVQPDICVVCDKEKLDDARCVGSPALRIDTHA